MKEMNGMCGVRFLERVAPFNARDIALLPAAAARRAIDAGVAEPYEFAGRPYAAASDAVEARTPALELIAASEPSATRDGRRRDRVKA